MSEPEDAFKKFGNLFGGAGGSHAFGDTGFDTTVNGKRAVKHDKAWIILARVHGNLYMAVQGKTAPPVPVVLLKLEPDEIFDL